MESVLRDEQVDAAAAAGQRGYWGAVWSLMLGVCGLISAEFLPAELLTPIARDLRVSEAMAGQAVTATAAVSLAAALLTASATRRLDRRSVLVAFSIMLVASDLLVALAPDLTMLLLARALLGVALGGFWSMASAVTIRLVPPRFAPRAMSLVFSGISIATIVAVPLGSYVGGLYGWRAIFLASAGFGCVTLLAQLLTLPPMKQSGEAGLRALTDLFSRRDMLVGIGCIVLVYAGHFGPFTYLRPHLEQVEHLDGSEVALALMVFGVANLAGTLLAAMLLERSLRLALSLSALLLGMAILGLAFLPTGFALTACLVALWGVAYGGIPVSWSTWIVRAAPDRAESGGGLIVAAVQVAITIGAAGGGAVDTVAGSSGVFALAAAIDVAAAVLVLARLGTMPAVAGGARSGREKLD